MYKNPSWDFDRNGADPADDWGVLLTMSGFPLINSVFPSIDSDFLSFLSSALCNFQHTDSVHNLSDLYLNA